MPAQKPGKRELQEALASLEAHMQPAAGTIVGRCLAWLRTATIAPNDGVDLRARSVALVDALGEMPADVWYHVSRDYVLAGGKWFPAIGELAVPMNAMVARRREHIRRLRWLIDHYDNKPVPAQRSKAQRLGELIAIYRRRGDEGRAAQLEGELARHGNAGRRDTAPQCCVPPG